MQRQLFNRITWCISENASDHAHSHALHDDATVNLSTRFSKEELVLQYSGQQEVSRIYSFLETWQNQAEEAVPVLDLRSGPR